MRRGRLHGGPRLLCIPIGFRAIRVAEGFPARQGELEAPAVCPTERKIHGNQPRHVTQGEVLAGLAVRRPRPEQGPVAGRHGQDPRLHPARSGVPRACEKQWRRARARQRQPHPGCDGDRHGRTRQVRSRAGDLRRGGADPRRRPRGGAADGHTLGARIRGGLPLHPARPVRRILQGGHRGRYRRADCMAQVQGDIAMDP